MYCIRYECDLFGNHTAPIEELCDVSTINFLNQCEAIKFIQECTSPITKTQEVCPWLSDNYELFIEPPNEDEKIDLYKNIHLIANNEDFKNLV